MRVLLFFNELSCSKALPKDQVDEAMKQFVAVLRAVAARRGDTGLISDVRLAELELAPGYYLSEWSGRPANVDRWRWIRRMQNRAPFNSVLPEGVGEGAEYHWEGRTAKGLGAAHLMDGALVSLQVDPAWDAPWIHAERELLPEDPDDDLIEQSVKVRHVSSLSHVEEHADWIDQAGISEFKRGLDIWEARGDLYPHMTFLPRTEQHFAGLRHDWVIPAARELLRINGAVAEWEPQRSNAPAWRSDVTPESKSRRSLCEFEDLDGSVRLFELHGRFAPGYGRVYFRLVPEESKARVAHIGDHI